MWIQLGDKKGWHFPQFAEIPFLTVFVKISDKGWKIETWSMEKVKAIDHDEVKPF